MTQKKLVWKFCENSFSLSNNLDISILEDSAQKVIEEHFLGMGEKPSLSYICLKAISFLSS